MDLNLSNYGTVVPAEPCSVLCNIASNLAKVRQWWHGLDPLPFLKGWGGGGGEGGSKFWLPPLEGGIWKIKKTGWKYGAGVGLLKNGTDTFPI